MTVFNERDRAQGQGGDMTHYLSGWPEPDPLRQRSAEERSILVSDPQPRA